jgi:hypothetical protein
MKYLLYIFIIIVLFYFYKIVENFNNNEEPKIIILIISSDTFNEYKDMYDIWKKYMNSHKNITSYFIENKKLLEDDIVIDKEKNTIYCNGKENYIPGILNKTIKSISYCLDNFEFDYIYRTNLSTVLNLYKLSSYVKNNKVDYAGQDYGGFVSGSGILLSKDACKKLILDKSLINHDIIDDVAISNSLKNFYNITNIDFYALSGLDDKIFNNDNFKKINNITFQFRCRIANEHTYTSLAMSKIYNKIYE